ncbi:MAG: glycosyltransferase family 2 protein, partial [Ekhidna sp.]
MQTFSVNSLVSVIMPVYNASRYLEQAIHSILDQTHKNLEILIADDSSTDNSWEIIEKIEDPRIIKFKNENNLGYLKTCNILFDKCSGNFITFQDADDFSDPRRIELQLNSFQEDHELGICGTSICRIDSNGNIILKEGKRQSDSDIKAEIGKSPQFCGATIMIKKSVLKKIGGYKEYFDRIGSEDYDWSFRIVEKFKAKNLTEALYFYRQHSEAISKEVNPRKMVSSKMVLFFADQRKINGEDDLMKGNHTEAKMREEKFLIPYQNDPSLIFVEYASWFMYNKMFRDAISISISALKVNPYSLRNLR